MLKYAIFFLIMCRINFVETCHSETFGSLSAMPSLLSHVLWGRGQASLFFFNMWWTLCITYQHSASWPQKNGICNHKCSGSQSYPLLSTHSSNVWNKQKIMENLVIFCLRWNLLLFKQEVHRASIAYLISINIFVVSEKLVFFFIIKTRCQMMAIPHLPQVK